MTSKYMANDTAIEKMRSSRLKVMMGLEPVSFAPGWCLIGLCEECGQLIGWDIPITAGRGGTVSTECTHCESEQVATLESHWPLAAIGADSREVTR